MLHPFKLPKARVAKPNYSFEKRQRELAKQKKKEEKAQRKANPRPADDAEPTAGDAAEPGEEPPEAASPDSAGPGGTAA